MNNEERGCWNLTIASVLDRKRENNAIQICSMYRLTDRSTEPWDHCTEVPQQTATSRSSTGCSIFCSEISDNSM
eukprot:scaffold2149_cov187-Cylindrotheca_fusiformis.AAC.11